MRPEAQLSDPIKWDTSVSHFSGFSGRILGVHVPYLPELWILGGKLSPDPRVMEAPETGYPELVLVQILLHFI